MTKSWKSLEESRVETDISALASVHTLKPPKHMSHETLFSLKRFQLDFWHLQPRVQKSKLSLTTLLLVISSCLLTYILFIYLFSWILFNLLFRKQVLISHHFIHISVRGKFLIGVKKRYLKLGNKAKSWAVCPFNIILGQCLRSFGY